MFTVYVLRSYKDERRYIGVSENFIRRLDEHKRGLVKSTKNRQPMELIYKEEFNDKNKAWEREKFFKSGKGREFLKNMGA